MVIHFRQLQRIPLDNYCMYKQSKKLQHFTALMGPKSIIFKHQQLVTSGVFFSRNPSYKLLEWFSQRYALIIFLTGCTPTNVAGIHNHPKLSTVNTTKSSINQTLLIFTLLNLQSNLRMPSLVFLSTKCSGGTNTQMVYIVPQELKSNASQHS